jgi:hypothetical protein
MMSDFPGRQRRRSDAGPFPLESTRGGESAPLGTVPAHPRRHASDGSFAGFERDVLSGGCVQRSVVTGVHRPDGRLVG